MIVKHLFRLVFLICLYGCLGNSDNHVNRPKEKQLIQNKFPNSSWIPNASGEVELFISGNIKYVGRFQNNSGYTYVIDYYRNGILIGKFRFFN
jgi:hypothetical protein